MPFYLNLQVVEHGLGHLPFTEKQVVTPTGMYMRGSIFLILDSSSRSPPHYFLVCLNTSTLLRGGHRYFWTPWIDYIFSSVMLYYSILVLIWKELVARLLFCERQSGIIFNVETKTFGTSLVYNKVSGNFTRDDVHSVLLVFCVHAFSWVPKLLLFHSELSKHLFYMVLLL